MSSSQTPESKVTDLQAMREKVQARRDGEYKNKSDGGDGGGIDRKFLVHCLNANELGDGWLFARVMRDRFVYNHQAAEWMQWCGHHWDWDYMLDAEILIEDVVAQIFTVLDGVKVDIESAKECNDQERVGYLTGLQERILKRISRLRTDRGRTKCLKMSYTCRDRIAIHGDEIDSNPWLLACANGVLDLRTGVHKEGRPGDYVVKASPTHWEGIDAPCPTWDRAVLEIMNGDQDMVDYLARLFGFAITGLTDEHVFAVLHGQGRNGKSLMVEAISAVVGNLAGPIPAEMLLDQNGARSAAGPSPDIMALRGLRMAFASETDDGRKFSPSRVKWFSGGDSLTGRYPHDKRLVTFSATHLLFLLTNHKPHAPADDFAFWERLHLVPFELSFVNRKPQGANERKGDPKLKDRLVAEYPGILAWLVRGCLEWQEKGLAPPTKVTEATAEYRKDEDLLAEFIETCCDVGPDYTVVAKDIYDAFLIWFQENCSAKKGFPQKTFGKLLKRRFESAKVGGKIRYQGIKVKDELSMQAKAGSGFK